MSDGLPKLAITTKMRIALCLILLVSAPFGWADGGGVVADVHPSPARSYSPFFAVLLPDNRYVARNATMLDLIATAYGLDPLNVQGGPNWLERDRFDIEAELAAGASKDAQRAMLKGLLAERFHLELTTTVRPMPAYLLSVEKPSDKLKRADGSGETGCFAGERKPDSINFAISCRNLSMDDLARQLQDQAFAYVDQPVVNSTGLSGNFDFQLQWTERRRDLLEPGAISLFDAVSHQLGLKLTLGTAPRPVAFVADVMRLPTPNSADLNKIMPPLPAPEFEVATIKPSRPDTDNEGRVTRNGINFKGVTMKDMLSFAWDLDENNPAIVNAPHWAGEERFDVVAKVAPETAGRAVAGESDLPLDYFELQAMMRALLTERFKIAAHMEDRPIDAYTLTAANPKLKPADPSVRSECKEGPGPDGKDPRLHDPIRYRLVSCRDVTMAEFAHDLPGIANGYIYEPVVDGTDLKGAFDFILSFTGANRYQRSVARSTDDASDPSGALSLFDAVHDQLGLKLIKGRRMLPALVIEHIDEKPTEN